jgi:hypothetical protein
MLIWVEWAHSPLPKLNTLKKPKRSEEVKRMESKCLAMIGYKGYKGWMNIGSTRLLNQKEKFKKYGKNTPEKYEKIKNKTREINFPKFGLLEDL